MAKTYDLKTVVCTVGGVPISGYGENDAIGFEWNSEIVTPSVTADGSYTYSRNNDRGLMVTITLMQTSAAIPLLATLMEAQHGDASGVHPPLLLPLPFAMVDPATGDQVLSLECVFVSRPAPSKGKQVGEVTYKMHLPSPGVSYGPRNVAPF